MVSVVGLFYGFRRGRSTLFMVSVAGLLVDSAATGGSIILMYQAIPRFVFFRTGFRRWLFYDFPCGKKTLFMVSAIGFVYDFRRGKERFVYGFRRWFSYGFRLLQDRGCLYDGNHIKNKKHQDVSVTNQVCIYIYIRIYIYIYNCT